MLIDSHCHIDLFDNPILLAQEYAKSKLLCVMPTMLPSHYQMALSHVRQFKNIFPALGLHPLRALEGKKELDLFLKLINLAEYIGEIGLDLSSEGKKNKNIQLEVLRTILQNLGKNKFVSIHSRNAHNEIAELLDEYHVRPICFHYFTGGTKAAINLAEKGHFFTINERMLSTKHTKILEVLPKENILVESDGPFLTKDPITAVKGVYGKIADIWACNQDDTIRLINLNFIGCRTTA